MTMGDGFVLSRRAFSSTEELMKTVLQEVYRLNFSVVVKTGSENANTAAETTKNAFKFTEEVYNLLSNF